MELFSEIYNCYYQIIKSIVVNTPAISADDLKIKINKLGYEESILYLIPKLTSNEWNLFTMDDDIFISNISEEYYVPLTNLQKSYIKSLLLDEKIRLFLDDLQLEELNETFADYKPLFKPEDFYYYDRFEDKDDFSSPEYISHFRLLLEAIKTHTLVDISYQSKDSKRMHHHYLPYRLEYSIKNDKFRLIGVEKSSLNAGKKPHIVTLNLEKIDKVSLLTPCTNIPDINACIKSTYYTEPVKIVIKNRRNALERTMLQFANYEKNTTKIDDNTYECLIYYNKNVETELLIEILSFGPMIQVIGHDRFVELVKQRLRKQARFI